MLLGLLALSSALAEQPLGYPIFVRKVEGGCEFMIQDMVMFRRSDLRKWMETLPDKGRRIDLVWSVKADRGCLQIAKSIIRRAGFINVVARSHDEATDYPSGLPPK